MAKDIQEEISQVKGLAVKEVQSLAELKDSKFYPALRAFLKKMAYDAMWNEIRLGADNPNLVAKKAHYDGIIFAAREVDKRLREARKDLERMVKD